MPSRPTKPYKTPKEAGIEPVKPPIYMKIIGFLIVGAGVAMLLTRYLTSDGKLQTLGIIEGLIILFPIAFGLVFLFPTTANAIVSGVKKIAPWRKDG